MISFNVHAGFLIESLAKSVKKRLDLVISKEKKREK